MAVTNGTGQGGKTFEERELASRVRTLALHEIEKALKNKRNKKLYEAVLIRLAGTVLPRLNEITGRDGETLVVKIAQEIAEKNAIPNPGAE